MTEIRNEFDSPWKQVLENYFSDFLDFFFPSIHQDINWSMGYEFLDKELQKVVRDAELGKRFADKLVKVFKSDKSEFWVFIHLEIQQSRETHFPERMFVYNYRLRDRYGQSVASLAVLTDENQNWRPQEYQSELWGCETRFRFPIIKLIDYEQQWDALETSSNPFATVVMAHLKTMNTRGNAAERKTWKLNLSKQLYRKGFQQNDVLNLFQFIDWIMTLPKNLDIEFQTDLENFEREIQMPYITGIERRAIEKGRQEGLMTGLFESISFCLEMKFGTDGLRLLPEISQIHDLEIIREIQNRLRQCDSLDDVKAIYRNRE